MESPVELHLDFRKAVKLGAGNLLRSSELRKLVQEHHICGDLSGGLQVQKVLGTKTLLYTRVDGGDPLFFQSHKGSSLLFPTLYAVWFGFMVHLADVETSEGPWESMQRGSELFAPGVIAASKEQVMKGDLVTVSVLGKIVAVGIASQNFADLASGSAGKGNKKFFFV